MRWPPRNSMWLVSTGRLSRIKRLVAICLVALLSACGSPRLTGETPSPLPLRSQALPQATPLTRIALGSCYAPQLEQAQVWNAIAAVEPQLLLLTGDNVYQSEERAEPGLRELRDAYAMLASEAEFAALRRRTTILATWDDHDYGLNDAGAEFPQRRESEALFESVWPIPEGAWRADGEGIYSELIWGPVGRRVQVLMLDSRSFRDSWPSKEQAGSSDATLLGETQWQWLQQRLQMPADLRLLVSSIPVLSERQEGENWARMPAERARLLDLLARRADSGLVILSGDTHFGAVLEREADDETLVELLSSSLNLPITEDARPQLELNDAARRGDAIFAANFGLLEINWDKQAILASLRGDDGALLLQRQLSFARDAND
ncbi:alkaline phosphatase D family protein [Pseudomarimonas arenosa]|uniref:Alkaline phosphatase family protein n=1 Tax=Pseudomarimonas arenosa TaxID=2774145 RepID=A0AAW3ZTE2_9GAMM|nr:alkaline phosphatase D family protein [Pseudomarimonas arenosa]MBD8527662.1 alkaline phosphatase family protein [Pseudomarimonas arenosa]